MMMWFQYFLAALQTLSTIEPVIAAQFHGGAADTATKVGSALSVLTSITSNLAADLDPMAGVAKTDIHPDLAAHAATIPVV